MRVRNAHTSAIDGHEPGALFDVDPSHPGFAPLLRSGQLVPATANDVRFGANDPPPSPAAVRELVAGVNARNRTIEELSTAVDQLTAERNARAEGARALQGRINELEALLAVRAGAPVDVAAISEAVRAAEEALTKRFDAAYAELVAENARLKADLDGLLAAPAASHAPASSDAPTPADKPAAKPRTPREG